MSKRKLTTRRDVLAGAGAGAGADALAGVAVAAPAIASCTGRISENVRWRDFIEQTAKLHRNGLAAAERAYSSGMDLDDLSGVTLHAPEASADDLPILWFGDVQQGDHYFSVTPKVCGEHTRIERGSGAYIIPPARKVVRS